MGSTIHLIKKMTKEEEEEEEEEKSYCTRTSVQE